MMLAFPAMAASRNLLSVESARMLLTVSKGVTNSVLSGSSAEKSSSSARSILNLGRSKIARYSLAIASLTTSVNFPNFQATMIASSVPPGSS